VSATNRSPLSDEIVLVGLSGGIDSAAAALLARERWPDLPFAALHQNLGWDDPDAEDDARKVAERIGAPLTVQRPEIAALWRDRKFLPMSGMPCPAALEQKAEPAMLWAIEQLGGAAHWRGALSTRRAREFVVDKHPDAFGLYCIGYLAGEESRAAKYRHHWPDALGRPVFPLLEAGKNKDDARAILKRHGIAINYRGHLRRSCQPCVHWSNAERELLATARPEHAAEVAALEREIGRTFDRRGPLDTLPRRTKPEAEQGLFAFVDGGCGAWCK